MKAKKKRRATEHGPRDVTPAGRSVMRDLFSEEEAIGLEIRSTLLRGLEQWLEKSDMPQVEAVKVLGLTPARVSDIRRGKVSQFSTDSLIRLAARAGLHPMARLVAFRAHHRGQPS